MANLSRSNVTPRKRDEKARGKKEKSGETGVDPVVKRFRQKHCNDIPEYLEKKQLIRGKSMTVMRGEGEGGRWAETVFLHKEGEKKKGLHTTLHTGTSTWKAPGIAENGVPVSLKIKH